MRISCHVLPASLLAAAACGSPSSTTVRLHPVDGFTGAALLLVHHPDGTLASRASITSSLDVAIADGDSVSIVLHDAGGTFIDTRTHVQRGDEIDAYAYPLGAGAFVEANVTLPSPAGASAWAASGPQALAYSTAATFTMSVPTGRTTVPVIGTAFGATGALGVYGDRAATIDPQAPAIALSQPIDFQTTTVTVTGAPAGATVGLGADLYLGDDDLIVIPNPNGAAAGPLTVPSSFADTIALSASAGNTYAGTAYAHTTPASATIDLSAPALPTVSAPAIASDHLSWTLTGGGSYDALSAYASSSADPTFAWRLDAPPGTASIALPQMPSDVAVPSVLDGLDVLVYERSDLDGYGDALAAFGDLPAGASWQERSIAIPSPSGVAPRASHGKLEPRAVLAALRR